MVTKLSYVRKIVQKAVPKTAALRLFFFIYLFHFIYYQQKFEWTRPTLV